MNTGDESLNVRPSASTSRAPIGTLAGRSIVTVLSTARGQSIGGNDLWYRVSTPFGSGYVHSSYVTCTSAELRICADSFTRLRAMASTSSTSCPSPLRGTALGDAVCSAPFLSYGDGPFEPASASARRRFRTAMESLLRTRHTSTALTSEFQALGFFVDELRVSGERFTLVRDPATCARGGGVFVVRESPTLDAIIEVPHVGFEADTFVEGYRLFLAGARALVIGGTHRCMSSVVSTCRGASSGICPGSPDRYRNSDPAAFDETFFQAMHEASVRAVPTAIAVSLHGKRAEAGEPRVIVSNGTTASAPTSSLSRRVAAALGTAGVTAGSCQHPTRSYRLCATTNVQGRISNGSTNACSSSRVTASGTFLHIEQNNGEIGSSISAPLIRVLRAELPRVP